ncbi:MAG TPA: tetratricopeptide repeat protein, partial [Chloroflexi bacterium]|nr:tetratricopeptide repeat protein [Chloroflexota bacterium]
MIRYATLFIVFTLGLVLMACQPEDSTPLANAPSAAPSPTLTATPTLITVKLVTPTAVSKTPTPTPLPPSATPEPTPTPTNTPLPSLRRSNAHRAFHNGDYLRAQEDFNALFSDPGAAADDHRQALYWRGRSELALNRPNAAADTFAQFLKQYPDDELTRPAHFNRALALEATGRYTPSIAAYQFSLLPDDDPLADYIYQRMGDLALNFDDYPAAQKWYQAALNATDDIGFQVSLREGIAKAWLGQKKFNEAISQYQDILGSAKIPAYRAKINRLIGEAYFQADDLDAAEAQWQQTLDQYPETFDAYLSLAQMVGAGMMVDDFQRGYIDYHGGSAYQPAVEAMDRFLASNPKNNADQALWISALSQRALGNYQDAIVRFDKLIANYPDSPLLAEAHIQRARTFGWEGQVEQAVKNYRDFAAQNPEHPLSQEALYKAALIEFQDDQFETAYKNFRRFADSHPLSRYADDARYRGGLAAFQLGEYAAAEAEWAALLQDYPAGDFGRAASYWQAKTLLLMDGQEEQAKTLLQQLSEQPFNYYGLRARDLLDDRRLATNALLDLAPPTPAEQIEAENWLAHWLGLSQSAHLSDLDKQILGDP